MSLLGDGDGAPLVDDAAAAEQEPPPAVPPAGPPPASDDSSSGSDSSSSSSSMSGAEDSAAPAAPATPRSYTISNRTHPCLKEFISHPRQGLWQDLRQNRFQGYDPRDHEGLGVDNPDLAKNYFSRTYGGAGHADRSTRESLSLVITWLWERECIISDGEVASQPELPPPGGESADLLAVLSVPLTAKYYSKSSQSAR